MAPRGARRNWKASEPVTAIGELRKSRSDAAVAGVVARRAVARVSTPEKKVAAAGGEVKEVLVVEVEKANPEPVKLPPVEKKPTPVVIHRMTNAEPARPSPEKKAWPVIRRRIPKQETVNAPEYEEIQGKPSAPRRSNGRMQNIVDLVMWRDVSKSALVFGLGTFLLISSSYAKDLNFNTITAASYLGLVYLGLRFLCKSILNSVLWGLHHSEGVLLLLHTARKIWCVMTGILS